MRKKLILVIIMALLVSVCAPAFAILPNEIPNNDNELELQYITVSKVQKNLQINNGEAEYYVRVFPENLTSVGYIEGTLKLVRTSTGVATKTKTGNMYLSGGTFTLSDSKTLTVKSEYHIEYTLKVYKSGKLVETITGKSDSVKC